MISVRQKVTSLKGQAEIWKDMFGYVELRIYTRRTSSTHTPALSLWPKSPPIFPAIPRLARNNIFAAHRPSNGSGGATLYGLTHSSSWLLSGSSDLRLASMVLMKEYRYDCFSQCVKRLGDCLRVGPREGDLGSMPPRTGSS